MTNDLTNRSIYAAQTIVSYPRAGGWHCPTFSVPLSRECHGLLVWKGKRHSSPLSPVLAHHLNHKCMIWSLSLCFVNVSFFPLSVVSPPGPGNICAGTVVEAQFNPTCSYSCSSVTAHDFRLFICLCFICFLCYICILNLDIHIQGYLLSPLSWKDNSGIILSFYDFPDKSPEKTTTKHLLARSVCPATVWHSFWLHVVVIHNFKNTQSAISLCCGYIFIHGISQCSVVLLGDVSPAWSCFPENRSWAVEKWIVKPSPNMLLTAAVWMFESYGMIWGHTLFHYLAESWSSYMK